MSSESLGCYRFKIINEDFKVRLTVGVSVKGKLRCFDIFVLLLSTLGSLLTDKTLPKLILVIPSVIL